MAIYGNAKLVTVDPFNGAKFLYAFNTKSDKGAALGHAEIPANGVSKVACLGVNNIKPGKASKLFASGSESSFYDIDAAETLVGVGWKVGRPKIAKYASSARSILWKVSIGGGMFYGFRVAKVVSDKWEAAMIAAGLSKVTASENQGDIVFGANQVCAASSSVFGKMPKQTISTTTGTGDAQRTSARSVFAPLGDAPSA